MSQYADDQILLAFAAEREHGGDILARYIAEHPHLRDDLLDVFHEVRLRQTLGPGNLETVGENVVAAAWARFSAWSPATTQAATGAVLKAKLQGKGVRNVARAGEIPRVILIAVRDRCITASSYPPEFLRRLASAAAIDLDEVRAFVALPPIISGKPAFSAEGKPRVDLQKSFQAIVRESGLTEEEQADLLRNMG